MATAGSGNGAAAGSGGGSAGGGGSRLLKRYGPIALVVVIIVGIIAVVSIVNGGDDDSGVSAGGGTTVAGTNASLPLTFQEAKAQGKEGDIKWGDGCNTETGRVKIPVSNAPPCVEPWDTSKDNGGATSQGVTKDEIIVAVYKGQPDPLQQAIVEGAGADTDPAAINQTQVDYLKMFEAVSQMYGRTLKIETIEATGGPTDATAAQADAQKVIDMKAFAAIGGPGQTPAWFQELVAAKIICMCGTAQPQSVIEKSAPYLWPLGSTPEQADEHFAELVGKQLVGKKAQYAGSTELQNKTRVFGWVQAETETDQYKARNDAFDKELADKYKGKVVARSTYLFDANNAANIATTVIARMKQAGVTTVLISTDPLIPKQITQEATKQNYFPEWVIGPSVLADTTIFGRTYDQQQWKHAFGLGLTVARTNRDLTDSFTSYKWFYGKDVPVNSQDVYYPGPARLLLGISLAGPDLTPETYRDGMFRFPPISGQITAAHVSWGNKLWPPGLKPDYNDADDATAFWWDPTATGKDEAGNQGTGMLANVDGGKRYLPGDWPTDPIPFFDKEGAVTVYDKQPAPDQQPDYPPWPGSPAAG
jgi:hypothetical protein